MENPTKNYSWAKPFPEIQKACTLFNRTELLQIARYVYIPLTGYLQQGPQCGLVALAILMGSANKETVDRIFQWAKKMEFSAYGEMFSAIWMAKLAEKFMPDARVEVHSGELDCDKIKEFLFSEKEILKILKSSVPIKAVQRRFKFVLDKDGNKVKVPRQQIIVTFDNLVLPQFVYVYRLRYEVDTWYSPVTQCYNCLNFGHTASQCKSKKRCKTCSKILNDEGLCTDCEIFCVHCKDNSHISTSKKCPKYNNQVKIKQAMANLNVSFKEAEKIVDNPSYASIVSKNKFTPLSSKTDFPELPPNYRNQSNPPNSKTTFVAHPHSSKSIPSSSVYENYKKRKVSDRSPSFEPVSREFDWSYTGAPWIESHQMNTKNTFEGLKDKIIEDLTCQINNSIRAR
ncbi:unnamed protein product [Ceutorhynchus assimilis]|uniref:Actin maturation protease n=1 Tax=Ceutorhynchus assimilis TaxID=467358 RepID=A0A9N9MIV0_9CUCU|nr:unnamed protein product [Ceutorhynchus assimilis]